MSSTIQTLRLTFVAKLTTILLLLFSFSIDGFVLINKTPCRYTSTNPANTPYVLPGVNIIVRRRRQVEASSSTTSLSSSSSKEIKKPVTNEKDNRPTKVSSPLLDKKKKRRKPQSARYLAVKALTTKSNNSKNIAQSSVDRLECNPFYLKSSTRDRGYARLLISTTERRLGQIDKIIEQCLMDGKIKKISKLQPFVLNTLRIGIVQLLWLTTAQHAAVSETVQVLREDSQSSAKQIVAERRVKFVNAILRRVQREKENSNNYTSSILSTTTVEDNVSPWLLNELQKAWGKDATRSIIECAMTESFRCLSLSTNNNNDNSGANNANDNDNENIMMGIYSAFKEVNCSCSFLPQGSLQILKPPGGPINAWPLYDDGVWWLQDPSATLPALVLESAIRKLKVDNNNDDTKTTIDLYDNIIDLCASPGGKTAQLCNMLINRKKDGTRDNRNDKTTKIIAIEISDRRIKRLEENLSRLKYLDHVQIIAADASVYVPETRSYGILLDAPCSATGTASKRPDVLRNKDSEQSIDELLDTQYKLACNAADNMLAIGGVLVYATCSLLKQESEDQVVKLLNRNDDDSNNNDQPPAVLETLRIEPSEVPGFESSIDENGWIRVLPGSSNLDNDPSVKWLGPNLGLHDWSLSQSDGFFVARLKRIK